MKVRDRRRAEGSTREEFQGTVALRALRPASLSSRRPGWVRGGADLGGNRYFGPRLAVQVGLACLVMMAAIHDGGKMREVGVARADLLAWPGTELGVDWSGRGAPGHAPGLIGWLAQCDEVGSRVRPRQVSGVPPLSVGGEGVSAAVMVGKDPRLGRNGSQNAGEEASIARARLLGVRLGEAGNSGPCKIASVNVTSLRRVVPAILKLDWDVLCPRVEH